MMVNRRHELTARVLEITGANTMTVDQAVSTWYQNIRSSGGYRLTESGYAAFMMANMTNWQVPIKPKEINKRALLDLDRKLDWPYYIDRRDRRLVMFSSRDAMMATLYGDIQAWLANTNRG